MSRLSVLVMVVVVLVGGQGAVVSDDTAPPPNETPEEKQPQGEGRPTREHNRAQKRFADRCDGIAITHIDAWRVYATDRLYDGWKKGRVLREGRVQCKANGLDEKHERCMAAVVNLADISHQAAIRENQRAAEAAKIAAEAEKAAGRIPTLTKEERRLLDAVCEIRANRIAGAKQSLSYASKPKDKREILARLDKLERNLPSITTTLKEDGLGRLSPLEAYVFGVIDARNVIIRGTVWVTTEKVMKQLSPSGVLYNRIMPYQVPAKRYWWIEGLSTAGLCDGRVFLRPRGVFAREGTRTYDTASGGTNTIPRFVYIDADPDKLAWLVPHYCPPGP